MTTRTLRPMTRRQWEALPSAFQYFHPWERANKPLEIDLDTKRATDPQPQDAKPARTRKAGKP